MNEFLFGVEQEFILLKNKGDVPSDQDIDRLYQLFMKEGFDINERNEEGKITGIEKQMPYGIVEIKCEVCTHILEIVFPPLSETKDFIFLYKAVYKLLQEILGSLNLCCLQRSVLPEFPENYIIRTGEEVKKRFLVLDDKEEESYSADFFPILISSTQIHLNILDSNLYKDLHKYYDFEYLFPLFFSNSEHYDQLSAHCLRPLLYRDNFPLNNSANSFPKVIPKSESAYIKQFDRCDPVHRDYSFICPRPELGTVEYRTACTQNDPNQILEMIALRAGIHSLIKAGTVTEFRNSREVFYDVCESGKIAGELLEKDYHLLLESIKLSDKQYVKYLETALFRISQFLYKGLN